jgi:F0F1-type ATP synthase assembly protein I
MTDPRKPKAENSGLRTAGMLMAIPSLLIAGPLVGFFMGKWGDRRLGCEPWLTIAGVVLGFFAAGRETYRIIRRVQDEEERNPKR